MAHTLYRSDGRKVELKTLEIPDLWHVGNWIKKPGDTRFMDPIAVGESVLDCWHLAHDLKKQLIEVMNERDAQTQTE